MADYVRIGLKYAREVDAGTIDTCAWVRAACRRQLQDLENKSWDFRFSPAKANDVCGFIERLPHIKGKWQSRNIVLEPWQCFMLTTIFGWVHKDTGYRRFRRALVVIPRKQGKTVLGAALALYMLRFDNEPGAEIYAAATSRDQARYCWDTAAQMLSRTPALRERFGVKAGAHSIVVESTASVFRPLSRDVDSLHALNPHAAIIDELHAHKTREVFDVLNEGTGARKQSLLFVISTEGDNNAGVFAEQVNYCQMVLDGRHVDDSYFGVIYTIDKEDDPADPVAWRKANPNIGVSCTEEEMRDRFTEAAKNPGSMASFLTKRLNVRVGAADGFFNMLAWDHRCKDESLLIEDFYGAPCVIGLDLASKSDLTAKVYLFPVGQSLNVFARFYLAEEQLSPKHPNYDVYRAWKRMGLLSTTPGPVTDYDVIEEELKQDHANFNVRAIGYDPYNATQLMKHLQDGGLKCVDVKQNVPQMSEPMKDLGARILSGRIKHDGNVALRWQLANVVATTDAKENVFPKKMRNENKIDGAVALMIALNLILRDIGIARPSIYADERAII